jgi:hypothetical protein
MLQSKFRINMLQQVCVKLPLLICCVNYYRSDVSCSYENIHDEVGCIKISMYVNMMGSDVCCAKDSFGRT